MERNREMGHLGRLESAISKWREQRWTHYSYKNSENSYVRGGKQGKTKKTKRGEKREWNGTNIENEKGRKVNYGYWFLDWLMAKWTANLQKVSFTLKQLWGCFPSLCPNSMLPFAVLALDCPAYDVALGCRGSRYLWKRCRIVRLPLMSETKTSGRCLYAIGSVFYHYLNFEIWGWKLKFIFSFLFYFIS